MDRELRNIGYGEEAGVRNLVHLAVIDIGTGVHDLHERRALDGNDLDRDPGLPHWSDDLLVRHGHAGHDPHLLADASRREGPAEHGTAGSHAR